MVGGYGLASGVDVEAPKDQIARVPRGVIDESNPSSAGLRLCG
jgi:hypothetical protein